MLLCCLWCVPLLRFWCFWVGFGRVWFLVGVIAGGLGGFIVGFLGLAFAGGVVII